LILLLDQAGWHGAKTLRVPSNISLMPLPRAPPELNGQQNIWVFMRQNWLSNRVFKSFDDIVDHCCYAWNSLTSSPGKSCPSHDVNGQPWVIQCEVWY
jgi:putative transposase